jgi:hypothetical protein
VRGRAAEPSAELVGVILRLDRVQLLTSTEVLPVEAVNVLVPSVSVAPTGIVLTISDCRLLLSPDRLLTVAARVPSVSCVPSVPAVAAAPGHRRLLRIDGDGDCLRHRAGAVADTGLGYR